jgi:hypothetical protein
VPEEKKEYSWTVLSRDEIVTYPKIGQAVKTIVVTYVGEGLPPRSVFIPKDEWTQAKEDEVIARDIHERLKFRPETRRAPIPRS